RLAIDPQYPCDFRLRKAFLVQLSNLQHVLTSIHAISSSAFVWRWRSLEVGIFLIGDIGDFRSGRCVPFYSGDDTTESGYVPTSSQPHQQKRPATSAGLDLGLYAALFNASKD